jgi:hypothetical protein
MPQEWIDVSETTPRIGYTATASQTAFTVPFVFFENSDLWVYQNEVLLTLDLDYTVTGAEDEDGGIVTLITGATVGDAILIARHIPIEKTTHIPPSGPLDIAAINVQISKLIAIDQQLSDQQERSLHFPDSDSSLSGEMAGVDTRKNKLLAFDENGLPIFVLGPTFIGITYIGVANIDSRVTAAATVFTIDINVVQTHGYATPGDGGGADYVRGVFGDAGAFQDAGGVYWKLAAAKMQRTVTAAGAVTALSSDDIIIINKTVGAATTVNVDWSTRTRPLTIVDGKSDSNANPITIVPSAGQTQYGIADYQVILDGNGGSVTLTPLANGTGAF